MTEKTVGPRGIIAEWVRAYISDRADLRIPDIAKDALDHFDDPKFISELFKEQKYPVFYGIVQDVFASTRHVRTFGATAVNVNALQEGGTVSVFDGWIEQVPDGHMHLKAMKRRDLQDAMAIRDARIEAEKRYHRFISTLASKLPTDKTVGQHYTDAQLKDIYEKIFTPQPTNQHKEQENGDLRRKRGKPVRGVSRKATVQGQADGGNSGQPRDHRGVAA